MYGATATSPLYLYHCCACIYALQANKETSKQGDMTTKLSTTAHTFGRMALALACMMPACIQAAPGDAARKVIMRTYGIDTRNINFKQLPSDGNDRYAYDCQNGKLTISGSSENAMAYAFYKYQAATSQGMATWSGNAMPQQFDLKPCKEQQGQSPYRYRYFLNVCTFGYTTPYWDWNRWEKELDLMALHGINMPLASVAHEAIAERVWLKMGLKKEDNLNTLDYTRILGFDENGMKYLNLVKDSLDISCIINKDSLIYKYELLASLIYDLINNTNTYEFEIKNKPIIL